MSIPHIGILVGPKGRGSNMSAIISACQSGELDAKVQVVVAPKPDLDSVDIARNLEVRVAIVPPTIDNYGESLRNTLQDCDLLCLAGYLRLLPIEVLRSFPGCILNVHPSLLPKYGGKGMYGNHVHQAVLTAGEKETGATVHLVTEKYDEGRILVQRRCPVFPDDDPESLAERVLAEEHRAYIEAIREILA